MLNITSDEICKLVSPMPDIVITGDFNFPIINWHTKVIQGGGGSECRRQAGAFINLSKKNFLSSTIYQ